MKTPAVGKERGRFDAPEISVALNFKWIKTKMERSKAKYRIYDGIFLSPIFGPDKLKLLAKNRLDSPWGE